MSVAGIVLPEDVATRLRSAARVRGVTVETFIAESIEMRLAADRQVAYIEERAERSDIQSAIQLVRSVPDVPPEDGDVIPDDAQTGEPAR